MIAASLDQQRTALTLVIDGMILDTFVRTSDEQGGLNNPGCTVYWRKLTYKSSVIVNEMLDPFGSEYMTAQLDLYYELSGCILDQAANKQCLFNMPAHVVATNPYESYDPAAAALHTCWLSRAIMAARPRSGAQVLDMGCGWGLSSEFAAYLGLNVTGVDINPDFVSLVNQRAALRGIQVRAVNATFDDYVPDCALSYSPAPSKAEFGRIGTAVEQAERQMMDENVNVYLRTFCREQFSFVNSIPDWIAGIQRTL